MMNSTISINTNRVKGINIFKNNFKNNEAIRLCVDKIKEINGEEYYVLTQNNHHLKRSAKDQEKLVEPVVFLCKVTDLTKDFKKFDNKQEPLANFYSFLIQNIVEKDGVKPIVLLSNSAYQAQVKKQLIKEIKDANAKGERFVLNDALVFHIVPKSGVWFLYNDTDFFMPNRFVGGAKNTNNHYYSYRAYDLYTLGDRVSVVAIINPDYKDDVICEPVHPVQNLTYKEKLDKGLHCLNTLQIGYINSTKPSYQYVHVHDGFDIMCYSSPYTTDEFVPVFAHTIVGKCKPLTRDEARRMKTNREPGSEDVIPAKYIFGTDVHGHERVRVDDTVEIELTDTVEYNPNKNQILDENDELYVQLSAILIRGSIGGAKSMSAILSIYQKQDLSLHPKAYRKNKNYKIIN